MKSSSLTLGRGEEVDVVISDLKASRTHAKLEFTKEGWMVSDLGSANGIFFQGEYVRKLGLKSGEHFTIGETIFEFLTGNENTRVLTAPLRLATEVVQMDNALSAQKIKVQNYAKPTQTSVSASAASKKFNPRTLLLVVALAGGYYYLNQDEFSPKIAQVAKSKVKSEAVEDSGSLSTYLPNSVNHEVEKTAEQYYRQGFREYREGNYLRAKAQFELALQVNPGHQQAKHYLLSADKEISEDIKNMMDAAASSKNAGRLRVAKGFYETAMRLMYYDRSNPNFIECEDAVKKLNEELGKSQQ